MNKKITFFNSNRDKLVGILAGSIGDKNTPVVVMCHGSQSSKNSNSITGLAEILERNNLLSFRFDFYGHGESDGKFEDITTKELIDDIISAINYLKKQGYEHIGLMGGSMGGGASILAAAQFPDLLFLALKSPVIDFKEIEEYRAKSPGKYQEELNYGWNRDSGNFNGYDSLRKITVPIMIVHGTKDDEVPTMFSKKAARLDPKIILHLISGADHRYSNPKHFQKMLTTMSKFITSQSRR